MLKRIKNLWNQSKVEQPLYLDLSKLTETELGQLSEGLKRPGVIVAIPQASIGDGKAEFIGPGTEEEYNEQQNKDKYGAKKLFGL